MNGRGGKPVANPMYADLDAPLGGSKDVVLGYEDVVQEGLGAAGEYDRPMRDACCRKRGNLDHKVCSDISCVTFLTVHEVKNIEMVFNLICKLVHDEGRLEFVTRYSKNASRETDKHRHMALTTEQLREYLPEFAQNVFLPRLIRLFSETGDQKLSVLELIDMYSALSRRAHLKWKMTVAFCVYDYDEDGVLDEGDLFRTISTMLTGTTTSKRVSAEAAALRIQARARGRAVRRKRPPGASHSTSAGASPGPIAGYATRILNECSSIRRDIMDYRYFEKQMALVPTFRDNFSVTPTKYSEIYRRYMAYQRLKVMSDSGKRACGSCWGRFFTRLPGEQSMTVSNPMLSGVTDPLIQQALETSKLTKDERAEVRQALAPSLTVHRYFASEIVIKRGSEADEMYLIVAGVAEVLLDLESEAINELKQDDYFGEIGMLHEIKSKRTAYVRAKTELVVLSLGRTELQALMAEHPSLKVSLLAQMDITLERNHLRTEAQLWSRYDQHETGWIVVKDCRKMVRCILTEDGQVRKGGNKNKKDPDSIVGIVNLLLTRSFQYENQGKDSVFKPVATSGVVQQQPKPRTWLKAEAVARICFHEWWEEQPTPVHRHTASRLKLERIWSDLDHDDDGVLNQNEVRALLFRMGDFAEDEFDEKVEHWFAAHDSGGDGNISMREFVPWFCAQDPQAIARANYVDWRQVSDELHHRDADVVWRDEDVGFVAKMKQMDDELAGIDERLRANDSLLKDDYDSATNVRSILSGRGWEPYGIHGAVRPPMIRTRMQIFRKLNTKGDTKYLRDAEHRKDHWRLMKTMETVGQSADAEFEYIGDILGEYTDTGIFGRCGFLRVLYDLKLWMKTHIFQAHLGLFETSILLLEHEFGHGISEVMRIMKWMLLLNLGLGIMWMTLVIVPRDYAHSDETMWNTTKLVLRGLAFSGSQGRSLFYDGYARQNVEFFGLELRMDVLYFVAILLHVLLSLFAILRTLGMKLTTLAQGGVVGLDVASETGENVFAVLGSYDCTVSQEHFATEMRQGIRHKVEMDLMRREEKLKLEAVQHSWTKRICHQLRQNSGRAATFMLLVAHVYVITQVLKYEQAVEKILIAPLNRLVVPLIISVLNVTVPKVLRVIVKLEDHLTGREVIYTYMGRVYIVKMVQLSTIMYSMAKIMSVNQIKQSLVDTRLNAAEVGGILNEYFDSAVANSEANCDTSDATAGCTCTEARFGAMFLRLVVTDALVFVGRELFILYSVRTGLPRFWKWNRIVNHFGKGPNAPTADAQEHGYKLQQRHAELPKLNVARSLRDRLALRTHQKPTVTWWKLIPRDDGHLLTFKKQSMNAFVEGLDIRDHGFEGLRIPDMRTFASCLTDAKLVLIEDIMDNNISPEQLTDIVERRRDGRDGRWTKLNHQDKFARLRKLSTHQIRFICEKLVESEGTWVEVTGTVEELRRYKLPRPEFSNFRSALLMIEMMYRQTFVWVGSNWCPWLPLVACLTQIVIFVVQKHVLLAGAYLRPAAPWSAEQAFKIFMLFALGTLGFTCLPTLIWLNQVPTCGPHRFAPDDSDRAKVFETFGVYLDDLPKEHLLNGEFTVVCAILFNPPSLLIMLSVLWTRYRYVQTQLKTTQVQIAKVEKAFHTEKKFLTTRLQDLTQKFGGGEQDLAYAQKRYERVMSHLDQQHLDWIIKTMGGKHHMQFLDPDEKGLGPTEMQAWLEFAAHIDLDNNGVIRAEENLMWTKTIEQNTIVIVNLSRKESKENFIRDSLTHLGGGYKANIIACTVRKYEHSEEKQLNKTNPDENGFKNRSWALVTFMNASSADLVLKEYVFATDKASASSAGVKSSWVALKWAVARTTDWNIPELIGEVLGGHTPSTGSGGETAPSDTAGLSDDDEVQSVKLRRRNTSAKPQTEIVREHNSRLHKALERALELKNKVDEVHKEVMGEEGED
eukprot:COSAG02_NODE_39_length_48074_cov_106.508890_29_plen_1927_part_00